MVMKKIAQPQTPPPWRYTTALAGIIAMFLAVIIGTSAASALLGASPTTLVFGWSLGMALSIAFVMIQRQRLEVDTDALCLGPSGTSLPVVALFALGTAVTLDIVGWFVLGDRSLAAAETLPYTLAEEVSIAAWGIMIVFMLALQPIGEELVLRGLAYPAVRAALGPGLGFVFVAIFYALFHFLVYQPQTDDVTTLLWLGTLLPFGHGLVINGVRAYTDSTRAAIVAHAAIGLFLVGKALVLGG